MEKNELIATSDKVTTAVRIQAQVNMIQEVMKKVMKVNVHYGVIPGCKKPSLYKPGAEKIMATFRLVADNPIVEDLSTSDSIRYRVTQRILTPDGALVGSAIGECSSDEEKYKWRRPVCDEEYNETPEDRRRGKWSKYQGRAEKTKQIRTSPADVANTILKMAVKRGLVGAVLVSTAASDVFDQDIEDLPDGLLAEEQPEVNHKPEVRDPQPLNPAPVQNVQQPPVQQPPVQQEPSPADHEQGNEEPVPQNPISEAQAKRLYAISKGNGYTDQEVKDYLMSNYWIDSSRKIERPDYEKIVAHFQTKKA